MRERASIVIVFLITAGAGAFGLSATVNALNHESGDISQRYEISTPATKQPERLLIPALDVNAPVQPVGITKNRDMAAPEGFHTAGWYVFGASPGEKGTAIIAGHLDNGFGLPGVFKHLSKLEEGDAVYVATRGGELLRFAVTDVETYSYDALPSDVFSKDGVSRIALITCTGEWLHVEQTYDERLVVYAQLS